FPPPPPTHILTLSLHDALPIYQAQRLIEVRPQLVGVAGFAGVVAGRLDAAAGQALVVLETADIIALPAVQRNRHPAQHLERLVRSEEHTSELQSRFDLVCRLLL